MCTNIISATMVEDLVAVWAPFLVTIFMVTLMSRQVRPSMFTAKRFLAFWAMHSDSAAYR